VAVDLLLKSRSQAGELGGFRSHRRDEQQRGDQGREGSRSADRDHAHEHSRAPRAPSIGTRLEQYLTHCMTSPRSAPKQLETGQEMGAGNGSRFWISGWWRKVLFLGRPDGFRAPGWAPRDQTCARREARRRNGVRAAREGWGGSLPMLAPVRSRCRQGCPQERTCPRSPRDLRPQAGNPGCSPARILGGEKGVLPMASARIGNRSLTPSPSPSSGFLREALPDLHEKFAATGRVASLLAC
jgi:hypothetical protein